MSVKQLYIPLLYFKIVIFFAAMIFFATFSASASFAEEPFQTIHPSNYTGPSAYNYTMGYKFTPKVNGQITNLWCFSDGTKTVRLYDSSGNILETTSVSCDGSWGSNSISPVSVSAGTDYIVAVVVGGSGGYRKSGGTGETDNVIIESGIYSSGDAFPTTESTYVYGLADVTFTTGSTATTTLDSESFEFGFGNWTNNSGNTSNWVRNSGSTSSSSTGPSSAQDSSYYIYVETSSGDSYSSGDTDIVTNNLGSSTDGYVDFYYHQYGDDQGDLYLQGYNGSSWQQIWSSSGDQGNQWNHVGESETSFSGYSQLRFRNVAAGSFHGDVALDNIVIMENSEGDSGGNIVFNAKNSSSLDNAYESPFVNRLQSSGYNVTTISDSEVCGYNYSNTELLIVRPDADDYTAHSGCSSINSLGVTVLSHDRYVSRNDLSIGSSSGRSTSNYYTVSDASHPVTNGFSSGSVNVYSSSYYHQRVWSLSSGVSLPIYFNGSTGYAGVALKEDATYTRAHWSAHRGSILTNEGWELWDNLVEYLTPNAGGVEPPESSPGGFSGQLIEHDSVRWSWSSVDDADYKLQYDTDNNFDSPDEIDTSETSETINDLSANTTYYARVAACNSGGCSDWSSTASVLTSPTTPVLTATAESDEQIDLNWDEPTGASYYNLQMSLDDAAWSDSSPVNLSNSSYPPYSWTGLGEDTQYYFRVRACNSDNDCSSWSTPSANATTFGPPSTPQNLSGAYEDHESIQWSWSPVDDATYELRYRIDGSGEEGHTLIENINSTNVIVDNLEPSTQYVAQVRARNAYGLSDWSADSQVATDDPPNRVVLLVDGDVNVQQEVDVPLGNLFMVAAKGDIVIDEGIGGAVDDVTTHVDGVYSAEGNIVLEGGQCANGSPDRRLNVSGMLIANSLRPFATDGSGVINNQRSLCADNLSHPSFTVSSRHDFLLQLTDFYKLRHQEWHEVLP